MPGQNICMQAPATELASQKCVANIESRILDLQKSLNRLSVKGGTQ